MSREIPVTFEPSGNVVWVPVGVTVLEASRKAGVVIPAPCSGRGICGSCAVRVTAGSLSPIDETEQTGLARAPQGVRLACRARVDSPVTIRPVIVQPGTRHEAHEVAGPLVAAVDLGTTTIAAAAIDPHTGHEVGRAIAPNRQAPWGADVLSRVSAALQGHAEDLRQAAEESVLEALVAASGGNLRHIERVVVAGNTVMAALLTGADVSSMAAHPFSLPQTPRSLDSGTRLVASLAPGAGVDVLPAISGFVGGDALAAMISTGVCDSGTHLLVDIGTNAEIVLAHRGTFYVASAAAGPAFDGSGVGCGGPAVPGAVQSVRLSDEIGLEVIGSVGEPAWFSGAGLVSALAELRRAGVVGADGGFNESSTYATRIARDENGILGFSFASPGHAQSPCLVLDQKDVRVLQLAKGAVRSGIEIVLDAGKVNPAELDSVLIAGAFGAALNVDDLVDLGIVPRAAADRTRAVGNAALAGAVAATLHPEVVGATLDILSDVTHVDLAADAGFTARLMSALSLDPYGS